MKSNIIYIFSFVILSLFVLPACKKDSIIDNANQVGISKVTYYATFVMSGSPYMSIVKGQAYTEPGVTASAKGANLPVTITGTVDNTTVGIYTITYSATNSDGFPATTTREVAVLPAAETPGVDLSGSYYYVSATATTATITKLAPGFYATSNCWSAATTIACQFICSDGVNIVMPAQNTPYGVLNGTATLTGAGALTWIVSIPSQGLNNIPRYWHAS